MFAFISLLTNESSFWVVFIPIIYFITILFVMFMIILENGKPVKTISWIVVVFLLPVLGVIFYIFFGQTYRKEKIFSRKGLKTYENIRILSSDQLVNFPSFSLFTKKIFRGKHKLITLLLNNSESVVTGNNEVVLYRDGRKKFDALIEALKTARHHIHMQYYIIANDAIGNEIAATLIEKAKEGIEVRLLYDDVGSWDIGKEYIRKLEAAGVKIGCFMKVTFPLLTPKVNYRNHRKIVVIDGEVAFTGGLNIADRYLNGIKKIGIWRDTHIMVKGGAVNMLQLVFSSDWYFVTNEILKGKVYFPDHEPRDGKVMQIVSSGPDSDWESISQAYFSAITSAREYAYITTPYFIPNDEILSAMKTAAMSGVDVRLLIPRRSDTRMPKWSTFSYVRELLEAGVRVYLYSKGFVHSKTLVVDGVISSVGSANFDFRSFEQNFEVNAMIYDEEFGNEMLRAFLEDLEDSIEVDLPLWEQRPHSMKIKESFSRMFSPLL